MTTDTEALRAQFERRMNLRGWSEANIRRDGLDYSSTQITEAWHAFQAGYAAAIAKATGRVVADDAAPECTCAAKDMTFGRCCKVTPNQTAKRRRRRPLERPVRPWCKALSLTNTQADPQGWAL